MNPSIERKFNLGVLRGLSQKQIEVHLGLYAGYVKHVNLLRENISELQTNDKEKNAYVLAELRRRFAFEFNGMRMHEYYFEQFEEGPKNIDDAGALKKIMSNKYGSWENSLEHFKTVSMSRGIGWAILYYDPLEKKPHIVWVGDHELGQLAGLPIIVALDMWEHAFMVDYTPAEKKEYIKAFFENFNWVIAEKRLLNALR